MSTAESNLALARDSNDPFRAILRIARHPNTRDSDTEMISMLTPIDDHSARATTRSRSKSPMRADDMSNNNITSSPYSTHERSGGHVNSDSGNSPPPGSFPTSPPSGRGRTEQRTRAITNGESNTSSSSGAHSANSSWGRSPQFTDNSNSVVSGNRSRNGSFRAGSLLSAVRPGFVSPQESQLSLAYGYAIRRDDGTFTRLIRADDPRLATTDNSHRQFPIQQGPEGLIVLPPPRILSPNSRTDEDPMVPADVINQLPRHGSSSGAWGSDSIDSSATQTRIDTIVAQSHSGPTVAMANGRPLPIIRKEKIYCDKWIHEGVCGFTQMGCKYKHEMPMDKATQLSLGLNHGVPNWYRRAYGPSMGAQPPVSPQSPPSMATSPALISSPPPNPARIAGPWRRNERAPSLGHSSGQKYQHNDQFDMGSTFGPIGQQPQPPQGGYFVNNIYSMLQSETGNRRSGGFRYGGDEDEDDEQVTYRPRQH